MQYHDAGIRGIGHDTVGLVNFDDGNAAGGNRHGLPRTLKALAIIDIAVARVQVRSALEATSTVRSPSSGASTAW